MIGDPPIVGLTDIGRSETLVRKRTEGLLYFAKQPAENSELI